MSISNIVFTGAATTKHGLPVLRADLAAFAKTFGFRVQSSVTSHTNILIASRADTVKASRAKSRGLTVMDYAQFIDLLGGCVPKTGATSNPYVDAKSNWSTEFAAKDVM